MVRLLGWANHSAGSIRGLCKFRGHLGLMGVLYCRLIDAVVVVCMCPDVRSCRGRTDSCDYRMNHTACCCCVESQYCGDRSCRGFKLARRMGYRRIAVTVVDVVTASAVRDAECGVGGEAESKDMGEARAKVKAIIIGAHLTGMGEGDVMRFI